MTSPTNQPYRLHDSAPGPHHPARHAEAMLRSFIRSETDHIIEEIALALSHSQSHRPLPTQSYTNVILPHRHASRPRKTPVT